MKAIIFSETPDCLVSTLLGVSTSICLIRGEGLEDTAVIKMDRDSWKILSRSDQIRFDLAMQSDAMRTDELLIDIYIYI